MKNKKPQVLIALDYDPTSIKVAEKGYAFAKAMNADVLLLHVISNPVFYATQNYSPIMGFTGFVDFDNLSPDSTEELIQVSYSFLDSAKTHLKDEEISTLVADGDFAETILLTAKNKHIDLIVVGTHSRKWLENILVGSVTEKVLSKSKIPMLIVPTKKS